MIIVSIDISIRCPKMVLLEKQGKGGTKGGDPGPREPGRENPAPGAERLPPVKACGAEEDRQAFQTVRH